MMTLAKRVAARLPDRWQSELKRIHFGRQIRKGTFETSEPEYELLSEFVRPGDWVLDIGANVGHYAKRLCELVGANGRVIAFEPVPTTFALLAANAQLFAHANVTLLNAAASDRLGVSGIAVPQFSVGLANYYQAQLTSGSDASLSVLTLPIDLLSIDQRISLVKIDVEGHEASVLAGMRKLIESHRPVLIVETGSDVVVTELLSVGYASERLQGSSNVLFRPLV
jgi:FkbM family methyltransferase